jgi:hypothetical protein
MSVIGCEADREDAPRLLDIRGMVRSKLRVGSEVVELPEVPLPIEVEERQVMLVVRIIWCGSLSASKSLNVRTRWSASAFVFRSSWSNAAVTRIAHAVNAARHWSLMRRISSLRVGCDSVNVIATSLDHAGEDVLDRLIHNAHPLTLKGDSMRKITAQRAKLDAAKKT